MPKLQAASQKEAKRISLGVLVGSGLMIGVFALVGQFQLSVIWGALLGALVAIFNFIYLAFSVQKAAGDLDRAQLIMKSSYSTRMVIIAIALIATYVCKDYIHPVAVVIPLLLPRFTIYILQFTGVYRRDDQSNSDQKGGESH